MSRSVSLVRSLFVCSLAVAAVAAFSLSAAHAEKEHSPSAKSEKPEKAAKASPSSSAATGKEVTLEGEMMCARCNLHETKECQSVLKVKDVKYYFTDNAVARENVEKVCGGGSRHAIVTGVVGEADGKKSLTPSSVKLP